MVFVLSIMFLLMAIGTSALAAASTAVGASVDQKTYDQLNLYTDSITKTFLASLNAKETNLNKPDFLGTKLMFAIYEHEDTKNEADEKDKKSLPQNLEIKFDNFTAPTGFSVNMSLAFPDNKVIITPEIDEITVDGVVVAPKVPKTATVNATMVVTVSAVFKDSSITANYKEKKLTTISTYELTNGYIEGSSVINSGKWRLVSHEKIDYQK